MKKFLLSLSCIIFVFILCSCEDNQYQELYEQAQNELQNFNYSEAFDLFKELGDYADAEAYLNNFKFKIKQLNEYTYDYTYKGDLLTEEFCYDSYGNIVYEYLYEYDNNNTVIGRISQIGDTTSHSSIEYDNTGNIIRCLTTTYKTDISGNEVEEQLVETYKYDTNNNLILYSQGTQEHSEDVAEYKYDTKNNCISIKYLADKKEEKYTYDFTGRLMTKIVLDRDKEQSNTIYSYEGSNRCIEAIQTGNTVDSNNEMGYKYDNYGNCIYEYKISKFDSNDTYHASYVFAGYDPVGMSNGYIPPQVIVENKIYKSVPQLEMFNKQKI